MKSKSFGVKLWTYFALFAAVIFCALWLLQTVFLQSFYNKMAIAKIEHTAEKIAAADNLQNLADITAAAAHEDSLLVFITDSDGNIIHAADEHGYGKYKRPERSSSASDENPYRGTDDMNWQKGAFRNLPDGYSDFLQRLSESGDTVEYMQDNTDTFVFGTSMSINGEMAVLYISKALGSVSGTIDILRIQLIWVTLASLAIAFAAAYFIARRFAKPIKELSNQAKHMGDESYIPKFEKGFCRETDELSDTIDKTSKELITAENYRREFFANISHDLRTPLTMINGYAEMVKDFSWENKADRDSDLDVIIRESGRLTELVNEILEYSSLSAGAKKYKMCRANLSEAAENVLNQISHLFKEAAIEIESHIEKDLYAVCDSESISRVIYNFTDNAVNHSGSRRICVTAAKRGRKIRVEVRDFGRGIDKESLDHIWDRYFTQKQQQRNKTGSGLGLAIAKEILTAHNAAFGASGGENEGTVFWFELDAA